MLRHASKVAILVVCCFLTSLSWADPSISSISPSVGQVSPVGSPLTIKGSGFGTQSGGTVTIGGVAAVPSSWSDTQIVAPVPSSLLPGFASVIVTAGGVSSNSASFLVIPVITAVSPATAPVGGSVTITGTSFGDTQGSNTVTFNDVTATATIWTDTSITFTIPVGAHSGSIVVTSNGWQTNGVYYLITPKIDSISPSRGPSSGSVTITGSGFGTAQNFNPVTFGGVSVTPSSWSDTAITVPVPDSLPAAHEIGHQLGLPGMHDGSRDTYNGSICDGENNPENFTGTLNGVPIHWGTDADAALKNSYGSSH